MQNPIHASQVTAAIEAAGVLPIDAAVAQKLADYGNLLMRWNARTNLTAIRTPEGIIERHLVECVAAAQALPAGIASLLDYGSGAGLPGIPISLVRPDIAVMLAESQFRKVAFLREAVRTLDLELKVHPGRVSSLPADVRFQCVALRAVDNMVEALGDATTRLEGGGVLAVFATAESSSKWKMPDNLVEVQRTPLPTAGYLWLLKG